MDGGRGWHGLNLRRHPPASASHACDVSPRSRSRALVGWMRGLSCLVLRWLSDLWASSLPRARTSGLGGGRGNVRAGGALRLEGRMDGCPLALDTGPARGGGGVGGGGPDAFRSLCGGTCVRLRAAGVRFRLGGSSRPRIPGAGLGAERFVACAPLAHDRSGGPGEISFRPDQKLSLLNRR